jgi:photosystem II stability/assembly factor-like uncharacterized protein
MIKKLTYFLILFMVFLSACSSGSEITNSGSTDKDKLSEGFLMVGGSGSIYGLNYYNNENYSYDTLNMPYFKINATIVNESKLMVAVGSNGVIMVTDDLINYESGWKMVQSDTDETLRSIAITKDGRYIAVGDNGVILTSQNGINWKLESSPTKTGLLKVVVSKSGLIVMLSAYQKLSGNSILSSRDGNTWESVYFKESNYINDIAVNENESFVAVGNSENKQGIILSSINAKDWNNENYSYNRPINKIAAIKNGNFIAISNWESTNQILYSVGGVKSWNATNFMHLFPYNSIASKDDNIVVVGDNNVIVKSINSGLNWKYFNYPSDVSLNLNTITTDYYGKFIAISRDREVVKSLDGENWALYKIFNSNTFDIKSIIKYKNQYIAVGNYGTILKWLPDNTWGTKISGTSAPLYNLITNKKNILAVGYNGTILSSVDGESWVKESSTVNFSLSSGLATISGKYLIVGDSGTILSSVDGGKKWTQESSQTNLNLYSIAEKNNILVAVGNKGIILSSVDGGKKWTKILSGSTQNIIKIINYNNKFIALTVDGLILSSVDGSKWNFENIALNDVYLNDFTCNNVVCVALGVNGTVFTTNDFKNWEKLSKINGYHLYGIMAQ